MGGDLLKSFIILMMRWPRVLSMPNRLPITLHGARITGVLT